MNETQKQIEKTPEEMLEQIRKELRQEKGSIVDEFDGIMIKTVGISWRLAGSGGTGDVTRAIVKHTNNPVEFVDRLAGAELLHPDTIALIREHLKILKTNPEKLAIF